MRKLGSEATWGWGKLGMMQLGDESTWSLSKWGKNIKYAILGLNCPTRPKMAYFKFFCPLSHTFDPNVIQMPVKFFWWFETLTIKKKIPQKICKGFGFLQETWNLVHTLKGLFQTFFLKLWTWTLTPCITISALELIKNYFWSFLTSERDNQWIKSLFFTFDANEYWVCWW